MDKKSFPLNTGCSILSWFKTPIAFKIMLELYGIFEVLIKSTKLEHMKSINWSTISYQNIFNLAYLGITCQRKSKDFVSVFSHVVTHSTF